MEALRGGQAPQAPALLPPAGLLPQSPLGSLVSPSPACPPPHFLPTYWALPASPPFCVLVVEFLGRHLAQL